MAKVHLAPLPAGSIVSQLPSHSARPLPSRSGSRRIAHPSRSIRCGEDQRPQDDYGQTKFFNTSLRRWTAFPASERADRFRFSTYEELTKRDKLNLDIFWLKDESLEDSANLPDPDIITAEWSEWDERHRR